MPSVSLEESSIKSLSQALFNSIEKANELVKNYNIQHFYSPLECKRLYEAYSFFQGSEDKLMEDVEICVNHFKVLDNAVQCYNSRGFFTITDCSILCNILIVLGKKINKMKNDISVDTELTKELEE